ncbi:hypothetical protein BH10BAC5_BH10BAC5_28740 [soil metagenome]
MEPVVKNYHAFKAVGMKVTGQNMNNEISNMWKEYFSKSQSLKNVKEGGYYYGVCSPMSQNTKEKGFDYIACREVNNFNDVPEGMVTVDIPEGKYAMFTYKGNIMKISTIYNYIFGEWVKKTDMKPDNDRNDFELYDERFKGEEDDSELDIYIPIKD